MRCPTVPLLAITFCFSVIVYANVLVVHLEVMKGETRLQFPN